MNHTYFYDILYKNSKDINFYVGMAQRYGTNGVLEVGSGSGRILLEIAKKGINIDGLEPNSERFECCKEKINLLEDNIKNRINIFQLLSSDYKTDKKYSLIIMPFRVLQEMNSVDSQEETLRYIKTLLKPNGILIFDLLYPSTKLLCQLENNQNIAPTKKHIQEGDKKFSTSFVIEKIDTLKQTFSAKRVYEFNGEEVSYSWNSRYLTRYEAEYMLKYLGFSIVNAYGNFESSSLDNSYDPKNMIFVAQAK